MNKAGLLGSMLLMSRLGGCGTTSFVDPAWTAPRSAPINHIVFVKLKDPADAPALIAYSDATLPKIKGVTRYACGQHLDMGRPNVLHDYDVGLYVGFDTNDAYAAYVKDPTHLALIREWSPKAEWFHIYDFADDTP